MNERPFASVPTLTLVRALRDNLYFTDEALVMEEVERRASDAFGTGHGEEFAKVTSWAQGQLEKCLEITKGERDGEQK